MKFLRVLTVFALSVVGSSCVLADGAASQILAGHPAWLQRSIHWERAPRDINPKLSAASTTAIYFANGGQFMMFAGTVYKQNRRISVSVGDSESIFKGTWVAEGSSVHVNFRLIYHDIRMAGESLPGPDLAMDFRLERNGKLLKVSVASGINLVGLVYEVNPEFSVESLNSQLSFADHVSAGDLKAVPK